MIILIVILVIICLIVIPLIYNWGRIEAFTPNTSLLEFSKSASVENGVSLKDNVGILKNEPALLGPNSSVVISYTPSGGDETGTLLTVSATYAQITLTTIDSKINLMIKHRHQRFYYSVLREVIQGVQQNMMIVLLMKADSGTFENGQHHELYVGNKLLVYSETMNHAAIGTPYKITTDPIIINNTPDLKAHKGLSGIFHRILTYKELIDYDERTKLYKLFDQDFKISESTDKSDLPVSDTSTISTDTINTSKRCNFDNEDLCNTCSQTQMDIPSASITYESDACKEKILGYCAANANDYGCSIVDLISKS